MLGVRITRNDRLDHNTPQSSGILRLAAINSDLSSSSQICAGIMIAQPHSASSVHHHGEQETIIYVLAGNGQVRWGATANLPKPWVPVTLFSFPPTFRTRN